MGKLHLHLVPRRRAGAFGKYKLKIDDTIVRIGNAQWVVYYPLIPYAGVVFMNVRSVAHRLHQLDVRRLLILTPNIDRWRLKFII